MGACRLASPQPQPHDGECTHDYTSCPPRTVLVCPGCHELAVTLEVIVSKRPEPGAKVRSSRYNSSQKHTSSHDCSLCPRSSTARCQGRLLRTSFVVGFFIPNSRKQAFSTTAISCLFCGREALTSPFLASGEAHKPNTATISRKSRLETAKSQTSSSHTNKLAATSGVEAAAGDDGGEVDTIPSFSQMHSPQRYTPNSAYLWLPVVCAHKEGVPSVVPLYDIPGQY